MSFIIDGIDFHNLDAEKYWSFPKSYKGDPKEATKNMIFFWRLYWCPQDGWCLLSFY